MNRILVPLALMASIMIAGSPAAAEQVPRSSVRTQVTVSARIVSGEVLSFGANSRHDAANQASSERNGAMTRTHGEITLNGQPQIALTEFH